MQIEDLYKKFLETNKITTDTRSDVSGSMFFALKGTNFDANKFAINAINKGAKYAIVDDKALPKNDHLIFVSDSLKTLQELAKYHRKNLKLPIIGITGSNGKTTTKELLDIVLKKKFRNFSTHGNLNNHIGLPLSILQITKKHEIAVLEIGANHKGENEFLTNICQPDIGLTTNIGKDHLGEFGGFKGVIEAYKEFTDYFIGKNDKLFFLNNDDTKLINLCKNVKTIRFGKCNLPADICGKIVEKSFPLKIIISNNSKYYKFENFKINTNFFGNYNIYNVLATVSIALHFKLTTAQIKQAIESYIPKNNRSEIISWGSNKIILDAYNANPTSMQSVIKDFAELKQKNKIVILGSMFELGKYSESEHKEIIDLLKTLSFINIILVGKGFEAFKDLIKCNFFQNSIDLRKWLQKQNFNNNYFLVKGSRGEKLEKSFIGLK
ncbi:MAG: UDP-N-acetylmuramoyl-tripeptide--D-alanyl-D-alanine ligase [Bacteroidota bacterium]|nr:UDP-N-acetylmuramoyl-tripeptide--D-alanyl-D-alanine ligase [Bacteroidota bacterium]